ncbi:MAG: hypothetical protein QOH88_2996 [Verrucomicrobiota bacterium]|jgi:hypothetical protein
MFSTWVGVLLLFAFFGLLALVVMAASPRGTKYEKTRAKARSEKLQTLNEQNANTLNTYAWVDKTKGVVRIPINDAMKLTVAELSQKKPAPGNPIAAPAADSAAPPTAPATVPPAPSPSAAATGTPKPTAVKGPNSENANQPAATNNPPPAPPGTQPGPANSPAASPPSAPAKAATSPSPKPSPSAPGTPLPVRGKTP